MTFILFTDAIKLCARAHRAHTINVQAFQFYATHNRAKANILRAENIRGSQSQRKM